jgi:hypothetical protein
MCTLMAGLKAEQDKLDREQEESHGESTLTAEIGETIHLTPTVIRNHNQV